LDVPEDESKDTRNSLLDIHENFDEILANGGVKAELYKINNGEQKIAELLTNEGISYVFDKQYCRFNTSISSSSLSYVLLLLLLNNVLNCNYAINDNGWIRS
jgi:hypothetical protein